MSIRHHDYFKYDLLMLTLLKSQAGAAVGVQGEQEVELLFPCVQFLLLASSGSRRISTSLMAWLL